MCRGRLPHNAAMSAELTRATWTLPRLIIAGSIMCAQMRARLTDVTPLEPRPGTCGVIKVVFWQVCQLSLPSGFTSRSLAWVCAEAREDERCRLRMFWQLGEWVIGWAASSSISRSLAAHSNIQGGCG
jgi:hypothetical protein